MDQDILPYNQAKELWSTVTKIGDPISMELDFAMHKKMLEMISIGPYYYYIFDFKDAAFAHVSDNVSSVLGYEKEVFTLPLFYELIHPDDRIYYQNFEQKACDYIFKLGPDSIFKYKIQIDFRIRKNDGEYIRVMQQALVIETTEQGGINKTLGVHTDISHIKSYGKPVLSFIGEEGLPSFLDVKLCDNLSPNISPLSCREIEIVLLLMEGKKSSEIALLLNLSKHTIQNHRKRMMSKTNSPSTSDLIINAVKNGWV